MKYKYSIPSKIRASIEWQLEHYPEDRRNLDGYKRDLIPSPTQTYSLAPGGSGASRTTENVAMQIVTAPYIRRMEIGCEAIERTLRKGDDTDRKLVDLVYWRREYTVAGAGLKLGLSCTGAYKRLNRILGEIACELGYISG